MHILLATLSCVALLHAAPMMNGPADLDLNDHLQGRPMELAIRDPAIRQRIHDVLSRAYIPHTTPKTPHKNQRDYHHPPIDAYQIRYNSNPSIPVQPQLDHTFGAQRARLEQIQQRRFPSRSQPTVHASIMNPNGGIEQARRLSAETVQNMLRIKEQLAELHALANAEPHEIIRDFWGKSRQSHTAHQASKSPESRIHDTGARDRIRYGSTERRPNSDPFRQDARLSEVQPPRQQMTNRLWLHRFIMNNYDNLEALSQMQARIAIKLMVLSPDELTVEKALVFALQAMKRSLEDPVPAEVPVHIGDTEPESNKSESKTDPKHGRGSEAVKRNRLESIEKSEWNAIQALRMLSYDQSALIFTDRRQSKRARRTK